MGETNDILRLNVGFIIHQGVGYVRDLPIEAESLKVAPDLTLTNLNGYARVTRTTQGLLIQVRLEAVTTADCVRCLGPATQKLEVDFTDLYAFSSASATESGLIVPENGKIDLAPVVREEMLVALPISPLCRPDCKGLCPVCGENLNDAPNHYHDDEDHESHLDQIQSLLD